MSDYTSVAASMAAERSAFEARMKRLEERRRLFEEGKRTLDGLRIAAGLAAWFAFVVLVAILWYRDALSAKSLVVSGCIAACVRVLGWRYQEWCAGKFLKAIEERFPAL